MKQIIPQHPTTILDYWRVARRYSTMIVGLVVVSVFVTGIMSKLSPKLYEARATIIPARQDIQGGGIALGGDKEKGGGGGGGGMVLEALGGKSGPSLMDTLQAILLSRKMAEAVVEQLNLGQYYGTDYPSAAVNAVRGEIDVRGARFKMIEVVVLTKDPKMAAEIVNAMTANLHRLHQDLNITAAKQNRVFLEARLAEKLKRMSAAEDSLKAFQTENRMLAVKEQAQAAADTVGELNAQIVELEVELAALREYATPSHPMINQLQAKLKELRRELDRMEQDQGRAPVAKGRTRLPLSSKAYPSFEEAPSLTLEYARLTRQMKVEEAVYGMLVGMLEQAKIAETRNLPAFQVLDEAIPPEYKSRPKTLQNIAVAGAVSLVLGLLLAMFLNYLEVVKAHELTSVRQASRAEEHAESESNGNGNKTEGILIPPKEIERFHG